MGGVWRDGFKAVDYVRNSQGKLSTDWVYLSRNVDQGDKTRS